MIFILRTLLLLNNRNMTSSALCSRCGLEDETFLHCACDCNFSRTIWNHVGFNDANFFAYMEVSHWLKEGSSSPQSFIFTTTVYWVWHHQNLMCLNNENLPLSRLSCNIHRMVDSFSHCFTINSHVVQVERLIRWNNDNYSCTILDVDSSCLSIPIRAGFGGIIRNSTGYYLSCFSCYINEYFDILYVELRAIYEGLILAKCFNIIELVCYTDFLHCINLLKGPTMRYHVYVVLIQDVKDLIRQCNVTVCYTLRKGNQCVNFMAKLGAGSDTKLFYHDSHLVDILYLLGMSAVGTLYSVEYFLPFSFFFLAYVVFSLIFFPCNKKKGEISNVQTQTSAHIF